MNLGLQLGYGMGELAVELTKRWQLTESILSPRDLEDRGLVSWATRLNGATGSVALDPQFYMARADHERLTSQLYWPRDYDSNEFYERGGLENMITNLLELNIRLESAYLLLPGSMAHPVTDDWLLRQREILNTGRRIVADRIPLGITWCLSAEALRSDEQVNRILDDDRDLKYAVAYVVCEHPNQTYRVHDPVWLANLLDLTAGLKLHGRRVVSGYAQHQSVMLACSSVDVIAAGTWMNVRSFVPGKFVAALEEEKAQRQVWYFCPQTFSEYTVPLLEVARRAGVLHLMAPQPPIPTDFASALFRDQAPTAVIWREPTAFRHYLSSLRTIVRNARQPTFQATVDTHLEMIDRAEALSSRLRSSGVNGGSRDFSRVFESHRAALAMHVQARGALLSRHWSEL
jgi:hypothetical protein